MTQAYEVTTFDVCASGFERLRTYEEFILVASIDSTTTAADLREDWESDIESCMRNEDFDYDAAHQAVIAYCDKIVDPLFTKPNPFNLEDGRDDIGYDEGCNAFLYVKVAGTRFPVY